MATLQPLEPTGPAPTFQDVWRMLQETDRKFQETKRLMKERAAETDRIANNLSKLMGPMPAPPP